MRARKREVWRDAAHEGYVAGDESEDAGLHARDILEMLESSSPVDDDMAAMRGLANGAAIGAVVGALVIDTYSMLT
jgi:hypothetical protein